MAFVGKPRISPHGKIVDLSAFAVLLDGLEAECNVQFYGGSEEQLEEDEELPLAVRPEDTPTKDLAIVDDGETEV